MWSTENKYFYDKIFHIKILSCSQASGLGLWHFFQVQSRNYSVRGELSVDPAGLRDVRAVPGAPPSLPAAGPTR